MPVVISLLKDFAFQNSVMYVFDKLFIFQIKIKTSQRSLLFIVQLRHCFRSHLAGGCRKHVD